MKIKIEIRNQWTGSILFEYKSEKNTIRETLEKAVESGADLSGANLRSANLRSADLRSANLRSANLSGADLRSADLSGANLRSANLSGADLRSANLRSANLSGADLSGADLRSANLRSANLRSANLRSADLSGANLRSANLRSANLEPIKSDFFAVLLRGKKEIPFLRQAIIDGKIDGSTYTGECSCLSGTLVTAAVHNNGPQEQKRKDLIVSCRDGNRPIERFFMGISPGHTPENNQASKLVLEWLDEFVQLIEA